jgi:hypothetical protein
MLHVFQCNNCIMCIGAFSSVMVRFKLAGALNGAPSPWKGNCCSSATVVAPYGPTEIEKKNTPQVHRTLAGDGIGGFVTQAIVTWNAFSSQDYVQTLFPWNCIYLSIFFFSFFKIYIRSIIVLFFTNFLSKGYLSNLELFHSSKLLIHVMHGNIQWFLVSWYSST